MKRILLLFFILIGFLCKGQTTSALLDGSQSTYTDFYHWKQISGNPAVLMTPDSAKCYVNGLAKGTYVFELVCRNKYFADSSSVKITVTSVTPVQIFNEQIVNNVLQWEVGVEDNVQYYLVEKSTDGINFTEFGKVNATGSEKYKVNVK